MLQTPKRRPRCALTGAPLTFDSEKRTVAGTPLKMTRPRYLEPTGDAISAPVTLHRHETEGVGLAYAVMMAKYLQLAGTEASDAERREMLAWWRTDDGDYGIQRVAQRLAEVHGDKEAQISLAAVLACHQQEADPAVIAAQCKRSETWLRVRIDECMQFAHRRLRLQ